MMNRRQLAGEFQSTPSRRGRLLSVRDPLRLQCFNPLPHAEGDAFLLPLSGPFSRFNPLPHAEGDSFLHVLKLIESVSIHSLTQRETICFSLVVVVVMFQSTPSRRGRPFMPCF